MLWGISNLVKGTSKNSLRFTDKVLSFLPTAYCHHGWQELLFLWALEKAMTNWASKMQTNRMWSRVESITLAFGLSLEWDTRKSLLQLFWVAQEVNSVGLAKPSCHLISEVRSAKTCRFQATEATIGKAFWNLPGTPVLVLGDSFISRNPLEMLFTSWRGGTLQLLSTRHQ